MPRKPTSGDASYVERKLKILKEQMEKAEAYINKNPWEKIEDDEKRDREFKFQKGLTDSLFDWTESYINMSGIMDVYNQLEAAKNRTKIKGSSEVSGIQMIVKELSEQKGAKNRNGNNNTII